MSEIIIEAGRTEKNYWRDLWRYRELFVILAWRDLSVRYKQTIIGILWAIIRPLLTMIVFTIIFGRIANCQPMETPLTRLWFLPPCCRGIFFHTL